MKPYDRRLPHWDTGGLPLFVTFSLRGSIPRNRAFPPAEVIAGKVFVAMDRLLDHATCGPLLLKNPEIARILMEAILDGERRFHRYDLHSFVVMPNHVHLLVTPKVPAGRWLAPFKGFTAHEANALLGTRGRPFWQEESYDHLVRNHEEFGRIVSYVENNPVRAGLAESPQEYPWSSAAGKNL